MRVVRIKQGLDIPIIMDAPFGHDKELVPFPIGIKAKVTANKNASKLELLEPAVENA